MQFLLQQGLGSYIEKRKVFERGRREVDENSATLEDFIGKLTPLSATSDTAGLTDTLIQRVPNSN